MKAQVVVDAQARLGECPLWCEREQALWWTDIDAGRLSRWWAHTGAVQTWTLPAKLGSFALTAEPGLLLLGLAKGVALFDTRLDAPHGRLGALTPVETNEPLTRINDGRCDPQGRFVFGTYNEAEDGRATGHFYRVQADLSVEALPLPAVEVANTLAFSPDGRTMYFSDSPRREILCVDYHADGRIGTPQTFARLAPEEGMPDGATVDAEGCLWTAVWGGGCVLRFDAQGRRIARVELPSAHTTCPVFGGTKLSRLFVTSARRALDAQGLQRQPLAGALYGVDDAGRGLPAHRFVAARGLVG
jgi:L-arabinonolactonase